MTLDAWVETLHEELVAASAGDQSADQHADTVSLTWVAADDSPEGARAESPARDDPRSVTDDSRGTDDEPYGVEKEPRGTDDEPCGVEKEPRGTDDETVAAAVASERRVRRDRRARDRPDVDDQADDETVAAAVARVERSR